MNNENKKVDVYGLLQKKFPSNEYALMQEVSDAAGFNRSRSADYIIMNLWPSRGLHLTGIELKSYRGDWLSELKKPQKAENIFKYCDYFVLLTTDETIAKIEEIPVTWGWWVIKGTKIIVRKEAPKLIPEQISRNFLAAMLKRACSRDKLVHIDSIQDTINSAVESYKNSRGNDEGYFKKEYDKLRLNVSDFERQTGFNLKSYGSYIASHKEVGEAVRFVVNNKHENIVKQLQALEPTAKKLLDRISEGLKDLYVFVEKEKVCSTYQVSTGIHCSEPVVVNVGGFDLCEKCHKQVIHRAEVQALLDKCDPIKNSDLK